LVDSFDDKQVFGGGFGVIIGEFVQVEVCFFNWKILLVTSKVGLNLVGEGLLQA